MRWPAILFVVTTLVVMTIASGRGCEDDPSAASASSAFALSSLSQDPVVPRDPGAGRRP